MEGYSLIEERTDGRFDEYHSYWERFIGEKLGHFVIFIQDDGRYYELDRPSLKVWERDGKRIVEVSSYIEDEFYHAVYKL